MKSNLLATLLAAIHVTAGLILLIFSSWFIAACAIAAPGFNYMLPAVVIRALALIRIASGYGQMWLGHKQLLTRLAVTRLALFQRLQNSRLPQQDASTEALVQHTEAVAALWVAWIGQHAGVILMMLISQLTLLWLLPPMAVYGWALLIGGTLSFGWVCIKALRDSEELLKQKQAFRHYSNSQLTSCSLWHLQTNLTLPDASLMWQAQQAVQARGDNAVWRLHLLSLMLLTSILLQVPQALFGQATLLIPIMLLLSARDWLASPLRSQPALADYLNGKSQLTHLAVHKLTRQALDIPLKELNIHRLKVDNRPLPPVSLGIRQGQLLLLQGSSGSGKTSLLQAIYGFIPYHGERMVNNQLLNQGLVDSWYFAEQQPTCLAGSLRDNLKIANPQASDETLIEALRRANLSHLEDSLDSWLGDTGRRLSGGELKRLNLARAWLSDAPLWCLDEPFEGLDSHQQSLMADSINLAAKDRIVILASHLRPSNLNINHKLDIDKLAEVDTSAKHKVG
ncbi:ATP-binding cassette domain-containing protein [Bowmanella pacifica]|uniref:Cysteine/glutathione ABC transporter ATP-binding protein/permease CydC n=1 Tax=Bowmanella pacifica TaxID=502051 RepID=A0A917Z141_9ALTE|nr:ATP-binding cassette domain-containing protein [Bowmanella pacifica]GGO71941.1 cysteine/glutathione ABC transporter ATP-binding protein/permease CydC [Bowmanella pacifica]